MSPILGIWASAQQNAALANSYESIATVTLTSSASSATFSSIPSTYKHLQIRGNFIPTSTDFSAVFRLNSDATASNYIAHTMSTGGYDNSISQGPSSLRILYTQDLNNSLYPASFIMDILDYQNTNKYKTTRTFAGVSANNIAFGSDRVQITSGLWTSTSAINTVTILSATGGYGNTIGSNFAANSKFALYGIKG